MKPYYSDEWVTLYHGDCREIAPSLTLTQAVIADPPYGEQVALAWDHWQDGWLEAMPGNSLWCFGSMRMFMERAAEFKDAKWHLSQDIVWRKQNGSSFHADRFRRVHESVAHFYRGPWNSPALFKSTPLLAGGDGQKSVRHRGRTLQTGGPLGDTGYQDDGFRLQKSVIDSRNENGRAVHPTQKPLGILMPLIEYATPAVAWVLDPFAGSGSTLLAARHLGRPSVGIEAEERYCEIAARRLSQEVLDLSSSSSEKGVRT